MVHTHLRPLTWVLLAGLALAVLGGCGSAGYAEVGVGGYVEEPYYEDPCCWYATVDVENLAPWEFVETFFLAPSATDLWTADLLGGPLAPGEAAYVGDFDEDWYDAEADLELGALVQWFDVFTPGADVTVFEVH